jgi:hypothetical protein
MQSVYVMALSRQRSLVNGSCLSSSFLRPSVRTKEVTNYPQGNHVLSNLFIISLATIVQRRLPDDCNIGTSGVGRDILQLEPGVRFLPKDRTSDGLSADSELDV